MKRPAKLLPRSLRREKPTASGDSTGGEIAPDAADESAKAPPAPDGAPQRSGWSRLARMGKPRATRANVLASVLAVLLGFAMVTQVHEHQSSGLDDLSQGDLIALLDGVNQQSLRLDQEAAKLRRTRDSLKSSSGDKAAISAAKQRKQILGILAGTLPAKGPGIAITIKDPKRAVEPAAILNAVEELRDAGAEAIQVGGVRVVASTWFGATKDHKLLVDGQVVKPPYIILAIGDPHTMSTAMSIPGGTVDSLKQVGASPTVTSLDTVDVDALRASKMPRYAQSEDSAD